MEPDVRAACPPERFRELFYRHYPDVVRRIYSLLSDAGAAEDVAQDVFLRLYRQPPEDLERVSAWLYRVATNAAYDWLRRRKRQQEWNSKERQELQGAPQHVPSSDETVIEQWEIEVVKRVLHKLSDRDREALILKNEGYSYREIADRLRVNPQIVGPLLARAGERFRKQYEEEEERPK